jgi:hypothetical protein
MTEARLNPKVPWLGRLSSATARREDGLLLAVGDVERLLARAQQSPTQTATRRVLLELTFTIRPKPCCRMARAPSGWVPTSKVRI